MTTDVPYYPTVYSDGSWEVLHLSSYELALLPKTKPCGGYSGYRFESRQGGKCAWAYIDHEGELQFYDPDRITNCRIRDNLNRDVDTLLNSPEAK
jgi:hypothetical protein